MSYFAFGIIKYKKDYCKETLDNFAWEIFRRGIDNSLFLFLSPNIPQKIINEMLDKQYYENNSNLRFLVTASPISDTTDALISPPYFGESDLSSVYKNIFLIDKWIKEILKYDDVVKVELFLTEGYDENFKKVRTSISEMDSDIEKEINEYGDIPSIIVEVEK